MQKRALSTKCNENVAHIHFVFEQIAHDEQRMVGHFSLFIFQFLICSRFKQIFE